jgi:hypothetical protein
MDVSLFYECAGANLLANNLEKIFATLCMRLMGLKSMTLVASAFLGRRAMQAGI